MLKSGNKRALISLCTVIGLLCLAPAWGQEAGNDGVETSGSVTVTARTTDGNSRTKSASASTEWVRKENDNRLTLRGLWNYASDSDGLSARNTAGSAKYDRFFNERRYGYAVLSAEGDKFASLNLRTSFGAGMGYQFYDKKLDNTSYSFSEEIGVSYVVEDYRRLAGTKNPDDDYAAGRLSGKLDWDYSETSQVFHYHEALFGFDDIEDVIVNAQQGIRTQMKGNLYTTFQINLKWDNTPAKGNRRLDVEYLVGVTYTF